MSPNTAPSIAASRGAISLSGITRIFAGAVPASFLAPLRGAQYKLFNQIWTSVLQ